MCPLIWTTVCNLLFNLLLALFEEKCCNCTQSTRFFISFISSFFQFTAHSK